MNTEMISKTNPDLLKQFSGYTDSDVTEIIRGTDDTSHPTTS